MRKIIFFAAVLLLMLNVHAQDLRNANWHFGSYAHLDFNFSPPDPSASSITPAAAGYASVSDVNGNTLFYSNGTSVWGKDNNVMPNGSGLYSNSGYRSVMIVPKPFSDNLYYLFYYNNINPNPGVHSGLYYSVIDMSLNSSNGDVVSAQKNIPLKDQNGTTMDYVSGSGFAIDIFKITSTPSNGGDKIWALCTIQYQDISNNTVRYVLSYSIGYDGINSTADGTSPSPTNYTSISSSYFSAPDVGSSRVSPDGAYFADAGGLYVNLYDFDNQTGSVSYNSTLYTGSYSDIIQGVEFSPNSQYVYFSLFNTNVIYQSKNGTPPKKGIVKIFQTDKTTKKLSKIAEINSSPTDKTIQESSLSSPMTATSASQLQVAIDGKIYVTVYGASAPYLDWLGCIAQPDLAYPSCSFTQYNTQLYSTTVHDNALPQWVYTAEGRWPKVYNSWSSSLVKGINNNVYSYFYSGNILNNINHDGVPPTSSANYAIQYDGSNAFTSWVKTSGVPVFSLANGDLQMKVPSFGNTTPYFNGATGASTSSPTEAAANHTMLAVTNSGSYISTYLTNLYVTLSGSTTHVSTGFISGATSIMHSYFNPALGTDGRLYIVYYNGGTSATTMAVYNVSGTTLSLINSPSFSDVIKQVLQVNNNDEVFTYDQANGVIDKYDYINKTHSSFSATGFTNSNIWAWDDIASGGLYTEDKFLAINTNQLRIYSIDTYTGQAKYIDYTYPGSYFALYRYVYVGNDLYLAGDVDISPSGTFTIGSQTVPYYAYPSSFITKLNLTNDFTRQAPVKKETVVPDNLLSYNYIEKQNEQSAQEKLITLFPNPASTKVTITAPADLISIIMVTDVSGRFILEKKIDGASISEFSITGLKPGIYNCNMKTNAGFITKRFIVIK